MGPSQSAGRRAPFSPPGAPVSRAIEFAAPPGVVRTGYTRDAIERGHVALSPMSDLTDEERPTEQRIMILTSLRAFSEGLTLWLDLQEHSWRVVAVCHAVDDAIAATRRDDPSVLVVTDEFAHDVALAEIRRWVAGIRIVVMMVTPCPQREAALIRQGVTAVISAGADRSETIVAVTDVLSGRATLSVEALRLIATPGSDGLELHLTSRQRDVLERLAQGQTTAEIARDLVVAPSTVKTHIKHLRQRFGVVGQQALVANAQSLLSDEAGGMGSRGAFGFVQRGS
jgi:DNA-binding NarL/FixJ family response regulator